jgi:hypothetical protein
MLARRTCDPYERRTTKLGMNHPSKPQQNHVSEQSLWGESRCITIIGCVAQSLRVSALDHGLSDAAFLISFSRTFLPGANKIKELRWVEAVERAEHGSSWSAERPLGLLRLRLPVVAQFSRHRVSSGPHSSCHVADPRAVFAPTFCVFLESTLSSTLGISERATNSARTLATVLSLSPTASPTCTLPASFQFRRDGP